MEFVNGKDDIPYINGKDYIPYMKWKIKFMFETTKQSCNGVIPLFPLLHHHSLLPRPTASSTRRFELLVSSRAVMRCSTSVWFLKKNLKGYRLTNLKAVELQLLTPLLGFHFWCSLSTFFCRADDFDKSVGSKSWSLHGYSQILKKNNNIFYDSSWSQLIQLYSSIFHTWKYEEHNR